jgi:uncharacterized membrane protein (UPF0127 family)
VRLLNASRSAELGGEVRVARSFWSRGRVLMLRAGLGNGEGLLIDPCSSIHTMWMRFPIDVLYVDRDHRVTKLSQAMPPWRIGPLRTGGKYVIELPAGTIARSGTQVGDQLRLEPAGA